MGGVGALLLGATLLLTSMHAMAAGTCPGRNGKVAVVDYPGKSNAIAIFKPNHRVRTLFKGVPGNSISHLSFSCNGKKIAFSEAGGTPSRALRVLDIATGKAPFVPTQRLTGQAPRFLADRRILFSGSRVDPNRMGGTFVVRPDGTGLRHLFGREQLAASSDGRWLAFTRTDTEGPVGNVFAMWLKDPSKVRRFGLSWGYQYPAWGPR